MARARSQNSKLDELIKLSREREEQMSAMTAKLTALTGKVDGMAPTVQQVADAMTFYRVGRNILGGVIALGAFALPIVLWFTDRWALVAQLFKRIP